ncbi:biofilm PGA synthesis lipoprotein PgaB [Oceanisphaera litoralis]|uniref:poly-beta-1,6-N-acetyl-D-glucosamine N-deacetylase PgaB n=1 Tax=Oceanisphaera litoralis TaxID=225144 RepID=UPI0019599519|nr:poly-beta-1,6-N-acetyl-D-glucosamine N-deacetylase PgaB [Oceanisphaera litoralis]MBM7455476.1 biofilm PGA synthesis lipoprotein PgaB [Oceanisphaera litoralis]
MRTSIFTLLLLCSLAVQAQRQPGDYVALSYHDIVDLSLPPERQLYPQTIKRDTLVRHFNWMRMKGYQPVSFQQILDAKAGKRPLPDKAVLLTFDDGYQSFYHQVYPLLKLYQYPAVLAVVGSWMEVAEGEQVAYGNDSLSRHRFLSWEQVRELQSSGLVEIASHSFDLHKGIIGNPQGNSQPAMVTAGWSPSGYETRESYLSRVKRDFARAASLFQQRLGRIPRIMVWPYGAFNEAALDIAAETGMPYTLDLQDGINQAIDSSRNIRRYLLDEETSLQTLDEVISGRVWEINAERVVQVDLDDVYDPDEARMMANMDTLIERINNYGITTVYLKAFSDQDGDGTAEALYFPNRHLPVKADLFNRVAWQLDTRVMVKVFAWMPVMAFDMGPGYLYVSDRNTGKPNQQQPLRLSPWDRRNRQVMLDIYEDLGYYTHFHGVLFNDDAFLTEWERADLSTQQKGRELIDLTEQLAKAAVRYRMDGRKYLLTARSIYADPIMNPDAERRFAQRLESFTEAYDYTVIMAMPYREKAERPASWLATLADRALTRAGGEKLVFGLQSRNWQTRQPVPDAELVSWLKLLQDKGIHNLGYYPDDFINNQPDPERLRPVFSLRVNPGVKYE